MRPAALTVVALIGWSVALAVGLSPLDKTSDSQLITDGATRTYTVRWQAEQKPESRVQASVKEVGFDEAPDRGVERNRLARQLNRRAGLLGGRPPQRQRPIIRPQSERYKGPPHPNYDQYQVPPEHQYTPENIEEVRYSGEDQQGAGSASLASRPEGQSLQVTEYNPYQLFPEGFHELLDIPIHVYKNGTSVKSYEKLQGPVVSGGYANTKLQGYGVISPPSSSPPPEITTRTTTSRPVTASRPTRPPPVSQGVQYAPTSPPTRIVTPGTAAFGERVQTDSYRRPVTIRPELEQYDREVTDSYRPFRRPSPAAEPQEEEERATRAPLYQKLATAQRGTTKNRKRVPFIPRDPTTAIPTVFRGDVRKDEVSEDETDTDSFKDKFPSFPSFSADTFYQFGDKSGDFGKKKKKDEKVRTTTPAPQVVVTPEAFQVTPGKVQQYPEPTENGRPDQEDNRFDVSSNSFFQAPFLQPEVPRPEVPRPEVPRPEVPRPEAPRPSSPVAGPDRFQPPFRVVPVPEEEREPYPEADQFRPGQLDASIQETDGPNLQSGPGYGIQQLPGPNFSGPPPEARPQFTGPPPPPSGQRPRRPPPPSKKQSSGYLGSLLSWFRGDGEEEEGPPARPRPGPARPGPQSGDSRPRPPPPNRREPFPPQQGRPVPPPRKRPFIPPAPPQQNQASEIRPGPPPPRQDTFFPQVSVREQPEVADRIPGSPPSRQQPLAPNGFPEGFGGGPKSPFQPPSAVRGPPEGQTRYPPPRYGPASGSGGGAPGLVRPDGNFLHRVDQVGAGSQQSHVEVTRTQAEPAGRPNILPQFRPNAPGGQQMFQTPDGSEVQRRRGEPQPYASGGKVSTLQMLHPALSKPSVPQVLRAPHQEKPQRPAGGVLLADPKQPPRPRRPLRPRPAAPAGQSGYNRTQPARGPPQRGQQIWPRPAAPAGQSGYNRTQPTRGPPQRGQQAPQRRLTGVLNVPKRPAAPPQRPPSQQRLGLPKPTLRPATLLNDRRIMVVGPFVEPPPGAPYIPHPDQVLAPTGEPSIEPGQPRDSTAPWTAGTTVSTPTDQSESAPPTASQRPAGTSGILATPGTPATPGILATPSTPATEGATDEAIGTFVHATDVTSPLLTQRYTTRVPESPTVDRAATARLVAELPGREPQQQDRRTVGGSIEPKEDGRVEQTTSGITIEQRIVGGETTKAATTTASTSSPTETTMKLSTDSEQSTTQPTTTTSTAPKTSTTSAPSTTKETTRSTTTTRRVTSSSPAAPSRSTSGPSRHPTGPPQTLVTASGVYEPESDFMSVEVTHTSTYLVGGGADSTPPGQGVGTVTSVDLGTGDVRFDRLDRPEVTYYQPPEERKQTTDRPTPSTPDTSGSPDTTTRPPTVFKLPELYDGFKPMLN